MAKKRPATKKTSLALDDSSTTKAEEPVASDSGDSLTENVPFENSATTTNLGTNDDGKNAGDGRLADAPIDPLAILASALPSHARLPGESRAAYWERTRKALRAAGLPRGQGPGTAYEIATRAAELAFPHGGIVEPEPAPIEPEPPKPEAKPEPEPESVAGVIGLGDIPKSWPELPANASLQIEIAWVSANRLRVRTAKGVDLSRAISPAPSYSALSWLETSILFPAKFADISVKATAETDDEKELVRREKLAIEEIRSILKEMLDAKS